MRGEIHQRPRPPAGCPGAVTLPLETEPWLRRAGGIERHPQWTRDFLRCLDRPALRLLGALEERVARRRLAVAGVVEHETLQMHFGDAHPRGQPYEFRKLVDGLLEAGEPERDTWRGRARFLLISDEFADIAHDAV